VSIPLNRQTVIILIILLPVVEVFVSLECVTLIGWPVALAWTALALVGGLAVVRLAGANALRRLSTQLHQGQLPGRDTLHDVLIVLAGLLLACPGFLTDLLALPLLISPARLALARFITRKLKARTGLAEHTPDETAYTIGPDGKPVRDIEVEVKTDPPQEQEAEHH